MNQGPVCNFIIGTAGHIDHGKTTLVGALTGIDTDRLAVEKERGISIDLGFAPLYLPSGVEAGIVDVPGHERFIKNMVAGSTGIDLLLLVVAADDGVMAQTIEHVDIAELLGVESAVVAVTKIDLVERERVDLVHEQVSEFLATGPFAGSPIVRVSCHAKVGLGDLVSAIEERARHVGERLMDFPVRLPIDRSFLISGSGRIVTGTLWSGVLTAESDLELQPAGNTCRLRRIEVHGRQVTKALPGQRVAVNIVAGGRPPARGDFLVSRAEFAPAAELLANVRVLSRAKRGIKRRARLRLHHGTTETIARIIPLEVDEILPGAEAFVRLVPTRPLPAVFRDRFILRTISPLMTVAGGIVLEARSRVTPAKVPMVRLDALASTDDLDVVREVFRNNLLPLTVEDVAHTAQLGEASANRAVDGLLAAGELISLEAWRRVFYLGTSRLEETARALKTFLAHYHRDHPYEYGPPKDAVRAELWPQLSSSHADILFDHFANGGIILSREGRVEAVSRSGPDPAQEKLLEVCRLLGSFSPPSRIQLAESAGVSEADLKQLLARLVRAGQIVKIDADIYLTTDSVEEARDILTGYLLEAGEITVSRFKKLLGTTRKYAIPLLEYFDNQKVTRRAGDIRTLNS